MDIHLIYKTALFIFLFFTSLLFKYIVFTFIYLNTSLYIRAI